MEHWLKISEYTMLCVIICVIKTGVINYVKNLLQKLIIIHKIISFFILNSDKSDTLQFDFIF